MKKKLASSKRSNILNTEQYIVNSLFAYHFKIALTNNKKIKTLYKNIYLFHFQKYKLFFISCFNLEVYAV
jgi:hypothetical protein